MVILFKDRDRRISLDFIKSFAVDETEKNKIFKLNLVDNDNAIDAITIDIDELLWKYALTKYIPKSELKTVINMINKKTRKNFEDKHFIKNIIDKCSDTVGDYVVEIDVEEIVYQNAKKLLDQIYALRSDELGKDNYIK